MQRQRELELRRALREIRTAIDKYKDAADQNLISPNDIDNDAEGYPPTLQTLVDGVTPANDTTGRKLRFLRRLPFDPMTRSTEWGLRSSRDQPDRGHGAGRTSTMSTQPTTVAGLMGRISVSGKPTVDSRFDDQWTLERLHADRVVDRRDARCGAGGDRTVVIRTSVTRAKEAVLREDLFRMKDAIDQVQRRQGHVSARPVRPCDRWLHAADSQGSVHRFPRYVADRDVRAGSGESKRHARRLRREERRDLAPESTVDHTLSGS